MASDGDPRLLKAMMVNSKLGEKPDILSLPQGWADFFYADYKSLFSNFQDGEHICVKLVRRLFKNLMIGKKSASINFFSLIVNEFPKSRHMITKSDIITEDKMSFGTVEKFCRNEVSECLNNVPDTEGILIYLKLLKSVKAAFVDTETNPDQRIRHAWYAIFLLRLWRQSINSQSQTIGGQNVTESRNFVTTNTYNGIEINGHSLLSILNKCREKKTPHLFIPALMTSQPCEKYFRRTRSMTSTYSTIINYSMFEILHRAKRSLGVSTIMNEIDEYAQFPRKESKKVQHIPTSLPSEEEVFEVITLALNDARDDILSLGNY